MSAHYDMVIHGAGIAGLALALCVRKKIPDLSILVLDRNIPKTHPSYHQAPGAVDDFDPRVLAVTPASAGLFKQIGAWFEDSPRVFRYEKMSIGGSFGQLYFGADEIGVSELGYLVENRVIHNWLLEAAQVDIPLQVNELKRLHVKPDCLELGLANGKMLTSQLLVGADGKNSAVRQLAGIPTLRRSYRQTALLAVIKRKPGEAHLAWQHFMPGGPLACLPMTREYCAIVWSLPESKVNQYLEMTQSQFSRMLMVASEGRFGRIVTVGRRSAFPLQLSHATSYCARRVTLIADAAHVVHPLAGQGLNLGLLDVQCLARQLTGAWLNGFDLGARRVLNGYERERKGDNILMQFAFDRLNWLFARRDLIGWAGLGNWGLNLVDSSHPIKKALARKAMGLT